MHNPLNTPAEPEVRTELPNASMTSKGKVKLLLILSPTTQANVQDSGGKKVPSTTQVDSNHIWCR